MNLDHVLWLWIALAIVLLPVQLFVTAPYGRHVSTRWGPLVDNTVGWIVMETVALAAFWAGVLWRGQEPDWLVAVLFTTHYVHRAWIYPLRARTSGKQMPLLIMLFAVGFNSVNGVANGWYAGVHQTSSWVLLPGLMLFILGMIINVWADDHLIKLRRSSATYAQPERGLFKIVSCPNHLGEIVQWGGFLLVAGNLAALAFFVWTVANLLPRSLAHHRWYREQFVEYPKERRALIPYVL